MDAVMDVYMADMVEVDGEMKQCYWCQTGIPKIDYSPLEERWATLEGIFEAQVSRLQFRGSGQSFVVVLVSPRNCP